MNGGKSCIVGFVMKNTLSDNGGVPRGICKMDQNNLTEVVETKNIVKTVNGAEADGMVVDVNSLVSMNMWGLTPDFMDILEKGFTEFLSELAPEDIKKEYLLPELVDHLIKNESAEVDVLETKDTWFGVTYQEDKETVMSAFKHLTEAGIYPQGLYQ